jgi:hypothetical protein
MPFYRYNEEYDDILDELEPEKPRPERGPDGFMYFPASEACSVEKLGSVARLMLDHVKAAGATAFRVRYDGGCDEGFAHPEAFHFGDTARTANEVLAGLVSAELVEEIRNAAAQGSMWYNAVQMYTEESPSGAVTSALDELTMELASCLLGEGFGTGEGELYGAFTADLHSGEIVDDRNAVKPAEME